MATDVPCSQLTCRYLISCLLTLYDPSLYVVFDSLTFNNSSNTYDCSNISGAYLANYTCQVLVNNNACGCVGNLQAKNI